MADTVRRNAYQFTLKECFIGVFVIGVTLGVSRLIGGLGGADVVVFVLGSASTLLATSRLSSWLGVGALFGLAIGALLAQVVPLDPLTAIAGGCGAAVFYAFVGGPITIAMARGLHMKRWLVSELGILTVATAFTPADPISTALVYGPLQLAMWGYVFFAIDGPAEEQTNTP